VNFDQETLPHKLAELGKLAGKPDRFVIAFSGGLDSTVLLHALASSRDMHKTALLAVHVDHSLHEDSASWTKHCESFAEALDTECVCVKVDVATGTGRGTEAAAREARYNAFRSLLRAGDWLLSAHHKDDQAETLLLNLMRGSGPAGLAGIGEVQPFAAGWLVRPLLSISRNELRNYANELELNWIDDPSNEDRQFDRNYLRHEVIPRLDERWPDVANRLRRSAFLATLRVRHRNCSINWLTPICSIWANVRTASHSANSGTCHPNGSETCFATWSASWACPRHRRRNWRASLLT